MTNLTKDEEQMLRSVVYAKMDEAGITATSCQKDRFWVGISRNIEAVLLNRIYTIKSEFLNEKIKSVESDIGPWRNKGSSKDVTRALAAAFFVGILIGGALAASCFSY